jgi:hypothetical protein
MFKMALKSTKIMRKILSEKMLSTITSRQSSHTLTALTIRAIFRIMEPTNKVFQLLPV